MLPITEQYLQSPCEVKTISNDLITTGSIRVIRKDTIEVANELDTLPIVHCDTLVKVNVYNNNIGFRVLVGKVFLSTPDFMRIIEVQNLTDFERRDFFRIKVDLTAKAYLIENDVPENGTLHLFTIHVSDLSLGGLFIKTKKKLEVGQRLVVNLVLLDSTSIAFCCEVQREQPITVISNGYGCAFLDNSTRQFDLLCKYIFDKQREQIRSTKEAQL